MNKERLELMVDIAKRAKESGLLMFDMLTLIMDLKLSDEVHKLDLVALKNADFCNFSHDILGIQNNIDRPTKKVNSDFCPRFCY